MACKGQLRVAPFGQLLGIDFSAALGLAEARGYDVSIVSELLQAAATGLVEAVNEHRDVSI